MRMMGTLSVNAFISISKVCKLLSVSQNNYSVVFNGPTRVSWKCLFCSSSQFSKQHSCG